MSTPKSKPERTRGILSSHMAKDYFQDIVPPTGDHTPRPSARKLPVAPPARDEQQQKDPQTTGEYDEDDVPTVDTPPDPSRGIRNINLPPRARYRSATSEPGEAPSMGRGFPPKPRSKISHMWIWILAAICVVVLGFLALFMFRDTTVTLTPRSQTVNFDQTSQFSAYPSSGAATGTLAYTVTSTDLQDSETVPSNGTTETQMKASGSITVYNDYSASSVKLIKNTRFQTPAGLIFRTPADIVIPGKQGSTAGHVTVTVFADQVGQQYNIGPTSRFTVPGLQLNAAMFAGIYAQSSGSMAGGFSGTQPGVSASVRQAAVSDIRTRLAQRAAQYVQSQNTSSMIAFTGLAEITYSDLPDVAATSSQVTIGEGAHIQVPIFVAGAFAAVVAQTMAVDTSNTPVQLIGGTGYGAQPTNATPVVLGTDSIDFSLVGSAQILWSIDTTALAKALAGRDQSVFQTVIGGFPGIEAARARIEPFWSNSFPSDPAKIKIIVESSTGSSTTQSQ